MSNIDCLRSLAVLSVVVEHTLMALNVQWLGPFEVRWMGVMGVFIFFVLTALVLMWSLQRRPHTLDFYIRRVFRIYPLAIVAVLAAYFLHAPVDTLPMQALGPHPFTLRDLFVSLALVQDVVAIRPVVGVLWTLPYEVQMYLLLPLLFFFTRRNLSLWPLLLFWLFVLAQARNVPKEGHNFAVAIAYFLPGVMAYVGFERWKPRIPAWLLIPFVLLLSAAFLYRMDFHKGWYFCLIVGLTLPLFHPLRASWLVVPSRVIARYSYGVYLMHPFAIAMGLYVLRGHSLAIRLLAEVIPLLALPVLAYHLIEHPMVQLGSRLAARAETRLEQHELQRTYPAPPA